MASAVSGQPGHLRGRRRTAERITDDEIVELERLNKAPPRWWSDVAEVVLLTELTRWARAPPARL